MSKIAFIGTGVMGAAMAGHLMDAGHDLIVYNRTKSKTDGLVGVGQFMLKINKRPYTKPILLLQLLDILRMFAKFILVQKEFFKMIVQEKFLSI